MKAVVGADEEVAPAIDDDPEPIRPDAGVDDGEGWTVPAGKWRAAAIRAKAPARTSWGGTS
jgi:hypothetical protein